MSKVLILLLAILFSFSILSGCSTTKKSAGAVGKGIKKVGETAAKPFK